MIVRSSHLRNWCDVSVFPCVFMVFDVRVSHSRTWDSLLSSFSISPITSQKEKTHSTGISLKLSLDVGVLWSVAVVFKLETIR